MDKFREFETFMEVSSRGSFAAAAEIQGVSPVMIGRRITQLEKRLGGTLFHRSTRKLSLTPQGEAFLVHCHNITTRLAAAENLITNGRNHASGHLIVSTPTTFGRRHVAPHLPKFMDTHPDVKISLNLSDQVFDLVRNGYELGIRLGVVTDPNLVPIRLSSNPVAVCGTPAYFDKYGVPRSPEELGQHNCLVFSEHGGQQRGWRFQSGDRQFTVKVNGSLSCNDGRMLTKWACDGLGLSWCSKWEVASELASGKLLTVLDDYMIPSYDIMAVYPAQSPLPAKIALFVDWLKSVYAQPDYWTDLSGSAGGRAIGNADE